MSTRNPLLTSRPYPVEQAAKTLGENLRLARLRRNLAIQPVAQKNWHGTARRGRCGKRQGIDRPRGVCRAAVGVRPANTFLGARRPRR